MTPTLRRRLRAWLLVAGAAATGVSAEGTPSEPGRDLTELSLEELLEVKIPTVVAASRFEQKSIDAPASVSVVTAEEIRVHGWRTLAEVLNSVPGFYLSYDRAYQYLGTRGFGRPGDYNGRVLILLDGHRLQENLFDAGLIGTEGILDLENVARVEIVKGPGSSMYGTHAFFGVVNVVTKRGADASGVEASVEAASFGTWGTRAAWGGSSERGGDSLVSASLYDSDGPDLYFREFDDPATNDGWARDCDFDHFERFFGRYARKGLTVEAAYSRREKGLSTAGFDTAFDDPGNGFTDLRAFVDVAYERSLGTGSRIRARLFQDWYRYYGDYVEIDPETSARTVNRDDDHGYFRGVEAIFETRALAGHTIATGVEYRDNYRQDMINYDVDPYLLRSDERSTSTIGALFVQDEYAPSPRFLINAGVRYDDYSTVGGTTNPRLAVVFKPRERVALKLLYGTAFRAPNAFEVYYAQPKAGGEVDLRPESVRTLEAVAEGYVGERTRLSASAFRYVTDGLIALVYDEALDEEFARNSGKSHAYGVELEGERHFWRGACVKLGYSWQEAVDDTTSQSLTNSPGHLARLSGIVPVAGNRLTATAEIRYDGARTTLAGNRAGGYTVADLTLTSRGLFKGLELTASVLNAFDRSYGHPGLPHHRMDVIEQDGRTYRLKLGWRF